MSTNNQNTSEEPPDATPSWLSTALREHYQTAAVSESSVQSLNVSEDLNQRCRQAALYGRDIAKLRAERKATGTVFGPLRVCFESLATRAKVDLCPLLKVFGIHNADRPDRNSTDGLARLARLIGLTHEDAMACLISTFALAAGVKEPATIRNRAIQTSTPKERIKELNLLKSGFAPQLQKELREATAALESVYDELSF